VRHPLTRAVGFTGSLRAGRALFDAAAARSSPIPVYAEMGSINPVFLLPGALRTRGGPIAQGLMNSVMLGVGQFCTKPGVVICLDDEATADFVGQMRKLVSRAPAGTMLNRALAGAFAEGRRGWASAAGVHVAAEAPAAPGLATHGLPALFTTDGEHFLSDPTLRQELFGPATLIVTVQSAAELERVADNLDGQLTATIHAAPGELAEHPGLAEILQRKAGRLIMNGYPTGVEVCPAMHHGGPYPASTDCRSTSVGTAAIERFARPVCYQDFPPELLPPELQDDNPLGIWRLIDGRLQR
jgi:NADP-dependent aldehyde dehydrogenase